MRSAAASSVESELTHWDDGIINVCKRYANHVNMATRGSGRQASEVCLLVVLPYGKVLLNSKVGRFPTSDSSSEKERR